MMLLQLEKESYTAIQSKKQQVGMYLDQVLYRIYSEPMTSHAAF